MKAEEYDNEDVLKTYFNQIKNAKLLTFEEEQDLSRRIQKGDEDAKQKLIEANLRLVVKIAKAYMTPDMNFLDIIQEGNMGLIIAAGKFDYHKNVRFSTYAAWWIRQSILRSLSNKKRSIRIPYRKEEALRRIKYAFNELNQELKRRPSVTEVACELKMTEEDVVKILSCGGEVASLDSGGSDDAGNLMELCEDRTYDPVKEIMGKCLKEDTMRFLDHLLAKERQILMYRFSFIDGKKYTLKMIGDKLGLSPETVRQIEIRAINKLKEFSSEMEEYAFSAELVGRRA